MPVDAGEKNEVEEVRPLAHGCGSGPVHGERRQWGNNTENVPTALPTAAPPTATPAAPPIAPGEGTASVPAVTAIGLVASQRPTVLIDLTPASVKLMTSSSQRDAEASASTS